MDIMSKMFCSNKIENKKKKKFFYSIGPSRKRSKMKISIKDLNKTLT